MTYAEMLELRELRLSSLKKRSLRMGLTADFNYTEHRAQLLDLHSDKTHWTQVGENKIIEKLWENFLL